MKAITVYFSHKGMNYSPHGLANLAVGNTEIVAQKISLHTAGASFELRAKEDYPFEYDKCVARSRDELRDNARPALIGSVDITPYDTIILGYPNWCGTMPMPVWTFLSGADFAGKTILPFCTNEGSGMGRSERDIAALCPAATVRRGLSLRGSKVADCDGEVAAWLDANLPGSAQ